MLLDEIAGNKYELTNKKKMLDRIEFDLLEEDIDVLL